jgi:hypothetical protein
MYANALGMMPLSGPYSFYRRVVLYFCHREVSFERPETSLLPRQIQTLQTRKTSQPRWSFLAIMPYGYSN